LNALPLWARTVNVWGYRLKATTFDRLLNLWLHRFSLMGEKEKQLFAASLRSGMHVVDIGANQGLYTMLYSRLVGETGRVYAFEPDPDLFNAAQRNCRANGISNVELHNLALGAETGHLTLFRSRVNAGDNRLAPSDHAAWFKGIEVPVAPLDDILGGKRVDFIKIDVQGWELEVLKGMRRVLRENSEVRIYLEFWPAGLRNAGCEPVQFLEYIASHSFSIWNITRSGRRQVTDFGAFSRAIRDPRYTNLLCTRGA
jgi:FkbM family methyltransferase